MKKVFYSELLNKYFDDEKECHKAELEFQVAKEQAEKKKQEEAKALEVKKAEISKEKKVMADAIQEAETELNEAYANLKIAKEQVQKILEESNKQMDAILKPAKEAVREAENKKFNAICEFNKKFGVYTKVYNGDKALEEFNRNRLFFNEIFNDFFKPFVF